jgi:hypothetical protein
MVQERNWIECNRVPEAQPLSFLVLGLVETTGTSESPFSFLNRILYQRNNTHPHHMAPNLWNIVIRMYK